MPENNIFKGTYHKMSAKHLSRYINEFAGRHNVRDFDTIVQMDKNDIKPISATAEKIAQTIFFAADKKIPKN